jgi:hypothetical protein
VFKPGEPPHAQAEYEFTPGMFGGKIDETTKKPEFEQGEWKFIARVPRHPAERTVEQEHKSDPATMQVVKRPLRVLLFAGGSTRDFQFTRTLLAREAEKKRVELSVYLQLTPAQIQRGEQIVVDVDKDHLLAHFPDNPRDESELPAGEKIYSLSSYDVVMAFDPDWTKVSGEGLRNLEQWVDKQNGGLVVIGGPVNTIQLARPGANKEKVAPVLNLYPVILEDARIQELERPTTEPYKLNFPGATKETEFLNLDEDQAAAGAPAAPATALKGWDEFFFGQSGNLGAKRVIRGFYNFYPVKQAKEGAEVIATFSDPKAKLPSGQEQPYIVSARYGGGRVVWLGSGEFWRLRELKGEYMERFWTKLARYGGAGATGKANRRITMILGRQFKNNSYVPMEARIMGRDGNPVPQNTDVKVTITPVGFEKLAKDVMMKPRPGQLEWNGWFSLRYPVKMPGEYTVRLEANNEVENEKFIVKESNPEVDDTRPDLSALYFLASEAPAVLDRIQDEGQRNEVRQSLQAVRPHALATPEGDAKKADDARPQDVPRLFFDLRNAELIPRCMGQAFRDVKNRGAVKDLWDKGPEGNAYWVNVILWITNGTLVVLTIVVIGLALFNLSRGKGAEVAFYLLFTLVLLFFLGLLQVLINVLNQPVVFSVVLVAIVTLLSIEWLARKLLRLA